MSSVSELSVAVTGVPEVRLVTGASGSRVQYAPFRFATAQYRFQSGSQLCGTTHVWATAAYQEQVVSREQ